MQSHPNSTPLPELRTETVAYIWTLSGDSKEGDTAANWGLALKYPQAGGLENRTRGVSLDSRAEFISWMFGAFMCGASNRGC